MPTKTGERLRVSQASAIELGPDGAETRVERLCKTGCKIQLRVHPSDHKLCHIEVPLGVPSVFV